MDKSIDKYPVKTVAKRTGENGIKSRTQISEDSQLKNSSKNALNRVMSKGVNKNTGGNAHRSSLASIPGNRSSIVRYYCPISFPCKLLLLQLVLTNYGIFFFLTSQ